MEGRFELQVIENDGTLLLASKVSGRAICITRIDGSFTPDKFPSNIFVISLIFQIAKTGNCAEETTTSLGIFAESGKINSIFVQDAVIRRHLTRRKWSD